MPWTDVPLPSNRGLNLTKSTTADRGDIFSKILFRNKEKQTKAEHIKIQTTI